MFTLHTIARECCEICHACNSVSCPLPFYSFCPHDLKCEKVTETEWIYVLQHNSELLAHMDETLGPRLTEKYGCE